MKRKEFIRSMDYLIENLVSDDFTCHVIGAISFKAVIDYSWWLKPRLPGDQEALNNYFVPAAWLGPLSMRNLEIRRTFLMMFKEIALTEKLYKYYNSDDLVVCCSALAA